MRSTLKELLENFRILSGDKMGDAGKSWRDIAEDARANAKVLERQLAKATVGHAESMLVFPSPDDLEREPPSKSKLPKLLAAIPPHSALPKAAAEKLMEWCGGRSKPPENMRMFEDILKSLEYSPTVDCWMFEWCGMTMGIERDGYIHA
jgi:hypothetical protein